MAQDIFASCTKLKSLTLPDADRSGLWGGDRMGHVKQILAHNPSVTDLRFYEPSDVDIIRVHYRMERDTNGGITTMVIVLEDGMYCGNRFVLSDTDFTHRDRDYLDLDYSSARRCELIIRGGGAGQTRIVHAPPF